VRCASLNSLKVKEANSRKKGIKQSKEVVDKRIKNTDQVKKEKTKKQTLMAKYGVSNIAMLPEIKEKISVAHKGSAKPRTKEHQRKIIESKRNNNTLKHTTETKLKISKILRKKFSDPNYDRSKFIKHPINVKGHKTGWHNNLFYRSSWELKFLRFCDEYEINVQSAENNTFALNYKDDKNQTKKYYPDFYLPDFDKIIEIKPIMMFFVGNNWAKIEAALSSWENYLLVTEEELEELEMLYEYICS
jgi:hypothetical protein